MHCITPIFDDYGSAALSLARESLQSIYVSAYVISGNRKKPSDFVTKFLLLCSYKKTIGIDVRFILDNPPKNRPNYHANRVFMRFLYDHGIPYALPRAGMTAHAKYIIIDQFSLLIGSHNLSYRSIHNPLESSVLIRGQQTAKIFYSRFLSIFNSSDFLRYPPATYNFDRIYP